MAGFRRPVGLVFYSLTFLVMDWNDLYSMAFEVTGDEDFASVFADDHEFWDGDPIDLVHELV